MELTMSTTPKSTIKSVLFLAYPNVGEQDMLTPWEMFRSLAWTMSQQGERLDVTLGSFEGGTITTHMGANIASERTIRPTDRFDLVYVPGGIGAGEASINDTVVDFVRAHHDEGRWVAANCAALGVLYRSGVLDGLEVTAPATVARRLSTLGVQIASPRRSWKIDPEAHVFTAGGAASVHPSTIALVWHLFGDRRAREAAAMWDTLPLHGESLFSLVGPRLSDDAAIAGALQDQYEMMFVPDRPAAVV
jgi:transcriptional regulator GlxA family with amidase domain